MTRLFVGNLSFDVTRDDLSRAFATYGRVSSVNVVMDTANGESRGFAFIEMEREVHAIAAMHGLHGTDLKGRAINVTPARPRGESGGRGNPPRGWAVVGDGRHRW
jgi:RNA recognition motif-containing protein